MSAKRGPEAPTLFWSLTQAIEAVLKQGTVINSLVSQPVSQKRWPSRRRAIFPSPRVHVCTCARDMGLGCRPEALGRAWVTWVAFTGPRLQQRIKTRCRVPFAAVVSPATDTPSCLAQCTGIGYPITISAGGCRSSRGVTWASR